MEGHSQQQSQHPHRTSSTCPYDVDAHYHNPPRHSPRGYGRPLETMSLQTIDARTDYGLKHHDADFRQQGRERGPKLRTDDVDGATPKIKFYQTAATRAAYDPTELQPAKPVFSGNRPPISTLYTADVEKAQPRKDPLWRRWDTSRGPPNDPLDPQYKLPSSSAANDYAGQPGSSPTSYNRRKMQLERERAQRQQEMTEHLRGSVPEEMLALPHAPPPCFRRVHKPITETGSGEADSAIFPTLLQDGRLTPRSCKYGENKNSNVLDQYVRGGIRVDNASTDLGGRDLNPENNPVTHCNVNIGNLDNGCRTPRSKMEMLDSFVDRTPKRSSTSRTPTNANNQRENSTSGHRGANSSAAEVYTYTTRATDGVESESAFGGRLTPREQARKEQQNKDYRYNYGAPHNADARSRNHGQVLNPFVDELTAETAWRQNKSSKWHEYERSLAPRRVAADLVQKGEYVARLEHGSCSDHAQQEQEQRHVSFNRPSPEQRKQRDESNRKWHAEAIHGWDKVVDNDTQSNSRSPRRAAHIRGYDLPRDQQELGIATKGHASNDYTYKTPSKNSSSSSKSARTPYPTPSDDNEDVFADTSDIIACNLRTDPRYRKKPPPLKWVSHRFEETGGDVFQYLFTDELPSGMENGGGPLKPAYAHQKGDPGVTSVRANLVSVPPEERDGLMELVEMHTEICSPNAAGRAKKAHENLERDWKYYDEAQDMVDRARDFEQYQPTHLMPKNHTIIGGKRVYEELPGRSRITGRVVVPNVLQKTNQSPKHGNHESVVSPSNREKRVEQIGPIALNSPRRLAYERQHYNDADTSYAGYSNLRTDDIRGASPRVPKNAMTDRYRTHTRAHDVSDINNRTRRR